MGIVRGALWATNIRYLNDDQEFRHAVDLIREISSTSLISKDHPDHARKEEFVEALQSKLKSLEFVYPDYIFTTSFTEKTDLLSQWRGYCPSNNGYCIEIDMEGLLRHVQEIFPQARILKCLYDDEEKSKQIKTLLNKHWNRYKKSGQAAKKFVESLTPELLTLASHFKHSSFAEESEHRIVVELDGNQDLIKFREGRYSIIPYIEIPIERRYIKSIIIGPTPRPALASTGLTSFLEGEFKMPSFFFEVEISHSKTPYRA